MTRKELLEQYEIDAHDMIKSPGATTPDSQEETDVSPTKRAPDTTGFTPRHSGRPGRGCGCRGQYRANNLHAKAEDTVNDVQVRKVLDKVQKTVLCEQSIRRLLQILVEEHQ